MKLIAAPRLEMHHSGMLFTSYCRDIESGDYVWPIDEFFVRYPHIGDEAKERIRRENGPLKAETVLPKGYWPTGLHPAISNTFWQVD